MTRLWVFDVNISEEKLRVVDAICQLPFTMNNIIVVAGQGRNGVISGNAIAVTAKKVQGRAYAGRGG